MPIDPSAQFRRSGQRDDRRRLLLCEPLAATGAATSPARRRRTRRTRGKSEHYGNAAFMEEQARLTDLIPRRLWVYALALVFGLGVVAGLEWLYAVATPRLAPYTTDGTVEAFDLDGEGTIAVWFSSTTLLVAAFVAYVVYTVRRHRRDDYHGVYRIWLWAAACWLLMSFDETASLHEGFKKMMVCLTGRTLSGDGSLWWAVPYFFLLGGVGIRLLIDMRECRLSSALFVLVAICYAVGVATQLEWILPQSGARGIMLEEGAEMVGNWLLLMAMALHARHVILDAEGLLHAGARAQSATAPLALWAADPCADEQADTALDRRVTVHPPHGIPRPAGFTAPVATAAPSAAPIASVRPQPKPVLTSLHVRQDQAEDEEDDEDDEGEEGEDAQAATPVRRALTKAEKKALRRRLEKMRREREKRAG